jgi:RNA polymerase sigma factor (sigma-70 family)
MNEELAEFRALMDRAKAGCHAARRELYNQYGPVVLRVVRRRLHPKMRPQFDSQDFTQDVWASFFHLAPDRFEFAGPDELAGFLEGMAKHKVGMQYRRKMQGVRENLDRDRYLADVGEVGGRDATPSQHAVADEGWDAMLAGQPPLMRHVLALLRLGYTYDEVGARTGLHPKAIQRRVRRLTEKVQQ